MLKGKTPLVVALVLGLLAGIVAYSAIKKREYDVRKGWDLTEVLVASDEITEGTELTPEMVARRAVPAQFVTSSVVRPENEGSVLGAKVLVSLQRGDPILWSQFASTRSVDRLSKSVQKKLRAVTINVNKTSSVGGWVRPNDHVDVIGTFRDPATNEQVAVTLMENVTVLATGKITGTTNVNLIPENQREYSDVSLIVGPEEAEAVVLAAELGTLSLALRNEEDVDTFTERGRATISTLLSGERAKAIREKREKSLITIIRGNTSENRAISGSGTK